MSFNWPKKEETPNPEAGGGDGKEGVPEAKSPAEMIAEALTPFKESFTALNTRLDSIEQATKRPEPKHVEGEQQQQTVSVLDNEDVAFAQRMTPIMLRQLELEARIIRNDIKAEYGSSGYGDLWSQFEGEINHILEGTVLVTAEGKPLRGDPQYVRNVVDMVFGRQARKAGMQFGGKNKGFFLESGSGSGDARTQPEADGLTEGQRRVMARMKVPTEDAKKVMAKLKFVQ